jgi:hypothetical protein
MPTPDRALRPALSCRRAMPCSPVEARLNQIAFVLLALWLVATLWVPLVSSAMGLSVEAIGLGSSPGHVHPFADTRTLWGVAHGMDVLSNLPFVLGGLWGFWSLVGRRMPPTTAQAMSVFFAGLVCTGLGSAWYHLAPDASGLVLDRLGMAVAFAGALALGVAERVSACASRITLWLALVVALLSAVMPHSHGNVWPWVVVQLGGMALMLWLALQKPVKGAVGVRIGLLIALYAVAKVLESADTLIFHATGETVSGHTLKHLVAALAVWPVVAAVRQNARAMAATPVRLRALIPNPRKLP